MTQRASKLDLDAAAMFLASVPEGHWTSYGDGAVAGRRSTSAGQAMASWIGSKGHLLGNVHRVLNNVGEISAAWTPAGEGLPLDAGEVAALLLAEGVRFTDGRADPDQRWRPSNVTDH